LYKDIVGHSRHLSNSHLHIFSLSGKVPAGQRDKYLPLYSFRAPIILLYTNYGKLKTKNLLFSF